MHKGDMGEKAEIGKVESRNGQGEGGLRTTGLWDYRTTGKQRSVVRDPSSVVSPQQSKVRSQANGRGNGLRVPNQCGIAAI